MDQIFPFSHNDVLESASLFLVVQCQIPHQKLAFPGAFVSSVSFYLGFSMLYVNSTSKVHPASVSLLFLHADVHFVFLTLPSDRASNKLVDLYLLVPPVHPLSKEYHFHNPIARVAEIQAQPSVPLRRESEVPSLDTPCSPQHEKKKEFHSLANLLRFDLIQFLQSKHNFEAIVAERHTFFDFAFHLYKTKLCRFPDASAVQPHFLYPSLVLAKIPRHWQFDTICQSSELGCRPSAAMLHTFVPLQDMVFQPTGWLDSVLPHPNYRNAVKVQVVVTNRYLPRSSIPVECSLHFQEFSEWAQKDFHACSYKVPLHLHYWCPFPAVLGDIVSSIEEVT